MFSKRIINSARFLKMPISTQCLYFHLGLHADDDGVVEAYTVIRQIGATEDDLKVLVAKGLVTVLNEDLVTYITDWQENNKIRADRKIDSIYKDLLIQMLPDVSIQQKKPRADTIKKLDNQWTSNGQPMDGIGKDSIGKESKGKSSKVFTPPTLEEVEAYCKERGNKVDAKKFYDYFTAGDWTDAKGNKVKSWKQKVITWEAHSNETTRGNTKADNGNPKRDGSEFAMYD